jgi:hypothetical protein
MGKVLTAFCSATLIAVAGCTTYDRPATAEGTILAPRNVRPGLAFVESVGVVPKARPAPSATAGGSADRNAYRLYLRMDNGGSQTVDQDNPTFMAGERVEVRSDGKVARVEPSLGRTFER